MEMGVSINDDANQFGYSYEVKSARMDARASAYADEAAKLYKASPIVSLSDDEIVYIAQKAVSALPEFAGLEIDLSPGPLSEQYKCVLAIGRTIEAALLKKAGA
jgi:hypothetical protein